MHSILGWASFCMNYCINAAWHGGDQPVALLRCNEAQVALIAAFRSPALLGLVSLIFLLTSPHIFSMGFRSVSLLANQAQWHHGHWTSFWYLWQCGQVPSPTGKWNQHLQKACQQKEAWSALKCPGRWLRWLWTSENTVAQHQQMTWQPKSSLTVETSHWTSSYMDSVPLHSSSRLWDLDFQMKCKIYFHLKRGLWTAEQQSSYFLLSPGKMLLTMFLFQKWLGSPFPEDVWAWWLLMHWLQLQFTPCEALPSVWIKISKFNLVS